MLEDYAMYFDDLFFLKKYRPTIDAILGWFDRNLTENGLIDRTGYSSYVDWVQGWDMDTVPPANRVGPLTVFSLIYAKALQSAAKINILTDRQGIADEYQKRSETVIESINKCCYDKQKKFYLDGPKVFEYSQHAQIWSVLCGAVKGDVAKELMIRMLEIDMPKVSYSMAFYLFRALEMVGLYDETEKLINAWKDLVDLNLTTWVEDPVSQRSDCHGWSALPLYEFSAMILGVRPAKSGYKKILITPHIGKLSHAKGIVCTAFGTVSVEWTIENSKFNLKIDSPEGVEKLVILPDSSKSCHFGRNISVECDLSSICV
jgi:hypothetical protein